MSVVISKITKDKSKLVEKISLVNGWKEWPFGGGGAGGSYYI